MKMIPVPEPARRVLEQLEQSGYEAYVVGGCVRDSLRGVAPADWDVCTCATPQEVQRCFAKERVVLTGAQHGTVTVLIQGTPIEVTTYRLDGTYSDSRRPDQVTFVRNLRDDLARRDFTMNAIAYSPKRGLCDPFSGVRDIENQYIRCVGDPQKRFDEDALRILRALRFTSILGFTLDPTTSAAVHQLCGKLGGVAAERIGAEMRRLLTGNWAAQVLSDYWDVFSFLLPELTSCYATPPCASKPDDASLDPSGQLSPKLEKALRGILFSPNKLEVRLFLLFRPLWLSRQFAPAKAREITAASLERLRYERRLEECVLGMLSELPLEENPDQRLLLKKRLRRLGEKNTRLLLEGETAAALSSEEYDKTAVPTFASLRQAAKLLEEILALGECWCLRQLAVSGEDLLQAGTPHGKTVGLLLQELLELVMEDQLPNSREALLAYAARRIQEIRPASP